MINDNSVNKKILIIHDRFQFRGGGERLVLILARALQADIATEFWTDESYQRSEAPGKVFVLDNGVPQPIVWRYFRSQLNFLLKTRKLIKNYGTVIFSGNNCLTASFYLSFRNRLKLNKEILKIAYVHHPVRYVYDLLPYRREQEKSVVKKFVYYDLGKWLIRFIYRAGLSRMDEVIANSENVRQRLIKYCHTESSVIYPPIQVDKFQWLGQSDYYLVWGRIDDLKRTLDIIKAFQLMPDKRLIVVGGGPLLAEAKRLTADFSNIQVRGIVNDEELQELVGNCLAFLYLPKDEDFGMIPVEGMAAGKPCIGVDEGGLRETIIKDVTGTLIRADYAIDDIVNAVRAMTAQRAAAMREACRARALEFREEIFVEKMKKVME